MTGMVLRLLRESLVPWDSQASEALATSPWDCGYKLPSEQGLDSWQNLIYLPQKISEQHLAAWKCGSHGQACTGVHKRTETLRSQTTI